MYELKQVVRANRTACFITYDKDGKSGIELEKEVLASLTILTYQVQRFFIQNYDLFAFYFY